LSIKVDFQSAHKSRGIRILAVAVSRSSRFKPGKTNPVTGSMFINPRGSSRPRPTAFVM